MRQQARYSIVDQICESVYSEPYHWSTNKPYNGKEAWINDDMKIVITIGSVLPMCKIQGKDTSFLNQFRLHQIYKMWSRLPLVPPPDSGINFERMSQGKFEILLRDMSNSSPLDKIETIIETMQAAYLEKIQETFSDGQHISVHNDRGVKIDNATIVRVCKTKLVVKPSHSEKSIDVAPGRCRPRKELYDKLVDNVALAKAMSIFSEKEYRRCT